MENQARVLVVDDDLETSAHTARVTAYAMRLTVEVAPSLSDDAGLEWGSCSTTSATSASPTGS
jgi:hypothetical protein